MKPVVVHLEAEAELRGAVEHYDGKREGLGGEFREEVEAAIGRIRQNPKGFAFHDDQGTRKCLVKRFPYTIFFIELDDAIWVAAIAHQRRRPNYWASRTPE